MVQTCLSTMLTSVRNVLTTYTNLETRNRIYCKSIQANRPRQKLLSKTILLNCWSLFYSIHALSQYILLYARQLCHLQQISKTCSIVLFIFDRFFYIYIYCRKCNAEFNKLIKTVGRSACFFPRKMMFNTPTFANKFDLIWIFSYSHLSSV